MDILFHELELATKWQRPSVLLAIYSSDYVRADADIALENRLHNLGQSAYHIKIKNQKSADVSLLISELANLSNVVFFVEGLRWGAGEDDRCTYRILNKSREFFIENQIRVVFWLTENEAIDLAHFAPDYWSFRHRVIEFVDSPKSEPDRPHVLESAWQGVGEFTDTTEDLDAKIALRMALLTDLPEGSKSTSARANLLLTLGMLHWRRGDYEKASPVPEYRPRPGGRAGRCPLRGAVLQCHRPGRNGPGPHRRGHPGLSKCHQAGAGAYLPLE